VGYQNLNGLDKKRWEVGDFIPQKIGGDNLTEHKKQKIQWVQHLQSSGLCQDHWEITLPHICRARANQLRCKITDKIHAHLERGHFWGKGKRGEESTIKRNGDGGSDQMGVLGRKRRKLGCLLMGPILSAGEKNSERSFGMGGES